MRFPACGQRAVPICPPPQCRGCRLGRIVCRLEPGIRPCRCAMAQWLPRRRPTLSAATALHPCTASTPENAGVLPPFALSCVTAVRAPHRFAALPCPTSWRSCRSMPAVRAWCIVIRRHPDTGRSVMMTASVPPWAYGWIGTLPIFACLLAERNGDRVSSPTPCLQLSGIGGSARVSG